METSPHITQTIRHNPTDSVYLKTPCGETNIPEPKRNLSTRDEIFNKRCSTPTNNTTKNETSSRK